MSQCWHEHAQNKPQGLFFSITPAPVGYLKVNIQSLTNMEVDDGIHTNEDEILQGLINISVGDLNFIANDPFSAEDLQEVMMHVFIQSHRYFQYI
jgi:hypothetical protein